MSDKIELKVQDKHVRNLFWLVFSPCLKAEIHYEREELLFPASLAEEWKNAHMSWFIQLDAQAYKLERFLTGSLKSNRLGMYAEKLLHFYFKNAPGFELLVANEQVPSTGKTISEIDFCVKWKGRILHIELAVKFFLEKSSCEWVGPNRLDSLEQKWDKMCRIQLPTARAILIERFGVNVESYIMLKGHLFRHLETDNCWFTLAEVERQNWQGARFAFPEKSDWINAFQGYLGRTINAQRGLTYILDHFANSTNSLAAVVLTKNGQQNLFVVDEKWEDDTRPSLLPNPLF